MLLEYFPKYHNFREPGAMATDDKYDRQLRLWGSRPSQPPFLSF